MAINKFIFYMMLILLASYKLSAFAQTTSYYALTKIDEYGKIDSKCNGGQFVNVSKNVCFDTDAEGNDIGNGKLYRDVNNHSNEHIYIGDSFHGKARYIFSTDYSALTVEINPHFKYYYKKSNVPSGVFTCSLIKQRSGGSGSVSYDFNQGNIYNNPQSSSGNLPNKNYYNSRGNYNTGSSTTQTTRKFKCAYCNGTGRIERNDNAPASFGQSKANKKCNECGKIYDPTVFNHYHVQCGHCGGTGNTK